MVQPRQWTTLSHSKPDTLGAVLSAFAQWIDLHDARPGKPLTLGCAYHDTRVESGSSGRGGGEGFTGRQAIGYDHGYDGEIFYLGLALDPHYVIGWVEGCLERMGEDHPEEELLFRDLWEDETQREVVIESLKADCEVRRGTCRPLR
jgi:hypothetical protein